MPLSVDELRSLLDPLPARAIVEGWGPSRTWTVEIKAALCKIAREKGFEPRASSIDTRSEWLYDITWLGVARIDDAVVVTDCHLVAESEWSTKPSRLDDDFQKLLVARSDVKLMIYNEASREKVQNIRQRFIKQIHCFRRTRGGEVYLFAGYDWSSRVFDIASHVTDGS